jgi:hypothetical protein
VAQLVALHEAQPPPVPLTARVVPSLPLLIAAKSEMAREVAVLLQRTQVAGASDLLMGRSISKVVPQSAQVYS